MNIDGATIAVIASSIAAALGSYKAGRNRERVAVDVEAPEREAKTATRDRMERIESIVMSTLEETRSQTRSLVDQAQALADQTKALAEIDRRVRRLETNVPVANVPKEILP